MNNEIMYLNLDDIIPNRFQPREVFDETALNELSDSIKKHGVLQPILVRMVGNKYEIIAGERRYKASVLAGLSKIPVLVKEMDDKESSVVAYVENAQRKNVSAIEEAKTCKRILDSNNLTQEELARELGITQSTLANKLRLLSLPMEIQESLMKNEISERHARSLLSIKDATKQIEMLNKIKEKRMTVRELDNEIKAIGGVNNMDNLESIDNTNTNMFFDSNINNNNSFFGINNEVSSPSFSSNSINESLSNNDISNSVEELEDNDTNLVNSNSTFDINKYRIGDYNDTNLENESPTTPVNNSTSFMDYLNNETDKIKPAEFEEPIPITPDEPNGMFFDNISAEEENVIDLDKNNSSIPPINNDFPNVVINDAIQPQISTFNDQKSYYVEDQSKYDKITNKEKSYNTVDTILFELKSTIDRIKNSQYKIDTEEIDYGDVYQITIKVNKNEQL